MNELNMDSVAIGAILAMALSVVAFLGFVLAKYIKK